MTTEAKCRIVLWISSILVVLYTLLASKGWLPNVFKSTWF